MRFLVAAVLSAGAMLVPTGAASAQPQQEGLVNVYINDVLDVNNNNVGIGVGANVAAQICGVQAQVGVLAQQVARNGAAECTSNQGTEVRIEQAQ